MNIKCVGTGTFMNCKTRNKKIFFILCIHYHCTQTFSFPSLRCFFLSSLSFTFLCFFFGLTSSPSTSTISPDSKTILCVRTGKTSSSLKGLSNKYKFLSYMYMQIWKKMSKWSLTLDLYFSKSQGIKFNTCSFNLDVNFFFSYTSSVIQFSWCIASWAYTFPSITLSSQNTK